MPATVEKEGRAGEGALEDVLRPKFRVFLAEDDSELRALISAALTRDGHVVIEAPNGQSMLFALVRECLDAPAANPRDAIVISDIRMPVCDGLDLLRDLRGRETPCPSFVFITAFPCAGTIREAYELGALFVFEKPFDLDTLRALVREHAAAREAPASGA